MASLDAELSLYPTYSLDPISLHDRGVYFSVLPPPGGGGQKYELLRGWGKKMITSLSKKRKREGKSGKRERKRRKKEKRERKKKKRERKRRKRWFFAHTG